MKYRNFYYHADSSMPQQMLTARYAVAVIAITLLMAGCKPSVQDVNETRFMMGTMVSFTVVHENPAVAQEAIRAAAAAMQTIEQRMTIYGDGNNAVKQLNRHPADQPMQVPDELDRLLEEAESISHESGGAFSPSLGALSLLWGFSLPQPPQQPPAESAVAALIAKPLIHCLSREGDDRWQRSHDACQVDLGGIAKGYALDQGMAELKRHGINNAMINAGGDIRLSGSHGERPWRIGIRDPQHQDGVVGLLELSGDQSVVTSGDYERFFDWHGKRYHHIIDPDTGYPARTAHSSTIVTSTATAADAWSTALFVAAQSLFPVLKQHNISYLLIDSDYHLHADDRMRQRLQLRDGFSILPADATVGQ